MKASHPPSFVALVFPNKMLAVILSGLFSVKSFSARSAKQIDWNLINKQKTKLIIKIIKIIFVSVSVENCLTCLWLSPDFCWHCGFPTLRQQMLNTNVGKTKISKHFFT